MSLWNRMFGTSELDTRQMRAEDLQPSAEPDHAGPAEEPYDQQYGAVQYMQVYFRELAEGHAPDDDYEAMTLAEIGFDTLSIAEFLNALGRERGKDPKTIAIAMQNARVRIPGAEDYDDAHGGWSSLPNLVQRVGILSEPDTSFTPLERRKLLEGGAVGPGNEVRPLGRNLTVAFVVKYVRAIGL